VTIPRARKTEAAADLSETSLAGRTEGLQTGAYPVPSTSDSVETQALKSRAVSTGDETLVKGKVVDSRGSPVPNVSITAANSKVSTTTDVNGNFSLKAGDTAFNATLSAAGFNARQAFLAAPSQNTIVLKEASTSLNEVVVMARKKPVGGGVNTDAFVRSDSMPVGGWAAFNAHLETGRSSRRRIAGEKGAGVVVLSFSTDKRGTPSKIRVETSLCAACDTEASRVLTSGPKWKLARGKRARVSIPFD
jgi:hypothetical protein